MKNKELNKWIIFLAVLTITNSLICIWAFVVILSHTNTIYYIKEYSENNFDWIEKLNTKIFKLENNKMCFSFEDGDLMQGVLTYCRHIDDNCFDDFLNWSGRRGVYFDFNN